MLNKKTTTILTVASLGIIFGILYWVNGYANTYTIRILNLVAINIIFAVTYNLIFGFTGLFSLGHAGFACVGAYTAGLLTMSIAQKQANFILEPCLWPLNSIEISFLPALMLAGLCAALFGLIVGIPALRLHGDYLALTTLGFAEIIRVIIVNIVPVTNGALGLKGIPQYSNLYWCFGVAILTIFVVKRLGDSSYGRALKAIREDEISAQSMGINLFSHKLLSFTVASFFTGIAGGLMANLISTIDPNAFQFILTFQVVSIVILGGTGSLTGAVIGSIIYVPLLEIMRFTESPATIFGMSYPGIPGMRMLTFAALLLVMILFYRNGVAGVKEFSWNGLWRVVIGLKAKFTKASEVLQ